MSDPVTLFKRVGLIDIDDLVEDTTVPIRDRVRDKYTPELSWWLRCDGLVLHAATDGTKTSDAPRVPLSVYVHVRDVYIKIGRGDTEQRTQT